MMRRRTEPRRVQRVSAHECNAYCAVAQGVSTAADDAEATGRPPDAAPGEGSGGFGVDDFEGPGRMRQALDWAQIAVEAAQHLVDEVEAAENRVLLGKLLQARFV